MIEQILKSKPVDRVMVAGSIASGLSLYHSVLTDVAVTLTCLYIALKIRRLLNKKD